MAGNWPQLERVAELAGRWSRVPSLSSIAQEYALDAATLIGASASRSGSADGSPYLHNRSRYRTSGGVLLERTSTVRPVKLESSLVRSARIVDQLSFFLLQSEGTGIGNLDILHKSNARRLRFNASGPWHQAVETTVTAFPPCRSTYAAEPPLLNLTVSRVNAESGPEVLLRQAGKDGDDRKTLDITHKGIDDIEDRKIYSGLVLLGEALCLAEAAINSDFYPVEGVGYGPSGGAIRDPHAPAPTMLGRVLDKVFGP